MPAHDTIFLQQVEEPLSEPSTWCSDQINDDDVEYIRRDIYEMRVKRQRECRAELLSVKKWNTAEEGVYKQVREENQKLRAAQAAHQTAVDSWMSCLDKNASTAKAQDKTIEDLRAELKAAKSKLDAALSSWSGAMQGQQKLKAELETKEGEVNFLYSHLVQLVSEIHSAKQGVIGTHGVYLPQLETEYIDNLYHELRVNRGGREIT